MNTIKQVLINMLEKPYAFMALLFLAVVLHAGSMLAGKFYADDFIQAAMFTGNAALSEKGLTADSKPASLVDSMSRQFNFFDAADQSHAFKAYGVLPWWSDDNIVLHFYRPLASLTHYIDYQLWPNNAVAMQAVNLLWYTLGLLAIYRAYQRLGLHRGVALVALLLVILDYSVFQVVSWVAARNMLMALCFGFVALQAYHCSLHSKASFSQQLGWYIGALLSLLCALLSAEGGVVICCYFAAYFFIMDRRRWHQRIASIVPFVAIVIAWRWYYQWQGFGAHGGDFYLDPARQPLEFIHLASVKFWSNFFELWSGLDIMSGQIRSDMRTSLSWLGVGIFIAFSGLLVNTNRHDSLISRPAAFFLFGGLLSLLPGLAVTLSPRVMIFPFIGLSVVFAELLLLPQLKQALKQPSKQTLAKPNWPAWKTYSWVFFNTYTVAVHGVLSLVLAIAMLVSSLAAIINPSALVSKSVAVNALMKLETTLQSPSQTSLADKHVVVLNTAQPFNTMFLAHELAFLQQPLPLHSRVLTTSWYDMTLKRISEHTFQLSSAPAFQFDAALISPELQYHHIHYAYLMQQLLGLTRSSQHVWSLGRVVKLPELNVTVNAVKTIHGREKPSELLIELKQSPDHYVFLIWDVATKTYQPFVLPAVGESALLPGIFSAE